MEQLTMKLETILEVVRVKQEVMERPVEYRTGMVSSSYAGNFGIKEIGDEEWKGWTKKLKDIHKKYGNEIQISFLFDKWNLLGYKDSPIDRGPEIFIELFNRRVVL